MDSGVVMDEFNFNPNFLQQQIPQRMLLLPSLSQLDQNPSLGFLIEKQREEIERYLLQQSLNARIAMQQLSKQQYASLIRKLECRAASILRKKEEEIVMMGNRVMQLEGFLKKKEEEKDAWEKVAREKAALMSSLDNALQQLQNPCLSSTRGGGVQEVEEESNTSESEFNGGRRGCCKVCGVRESCMLFLPCRHLCACGLCDGLVEECPVCKCFKQASVEIYLV